VGEFIVVLVTASSSKEGEKIATALVNEKLAACCNIVKDITSIYFWNEKLCKDKEVLILLKTRKEKFEKLRKRIKELHSYDVPEIIALPITLGSEEYLSWVKKST